MGKNSKLRAVGDVEADGAGGASKGLAPGKRRTTFVITEYWDDMVRREANRQGTTRSQIYLQAIAQFCEGHGRGAATLGDAIDDAEVYDEQKFYTATQDKKGHSAQFRVNIPKHVAGEIASLVQSGRVPAYTSTEAVVRDGLYHRIKKVAMWVDNDELENAVDIAMMNSLEMSLVEREKQAEELLENIRSNIARMVGRGETDQLLAYLIEREAFVDSLPSPYREDLAEVIRDARKRVARRERKRR
jgi:hypothetical protein